MRKKRVMVLASLACFAIFYLSLVSASDEACILTTSLINQDPYPAIPGDYVKLVFQVDGVDNPECGEVSITINEEFPFSLNPGAQTTYSTETFFDRDYESYLTAPFQVRVDKEALDGANPIEVAVTIAKGTSKSTMLEEFDIEVEDKRVDFEVYVKNYDSATNTLTFEILNIGKADVKAVTMKIPSQDNIAVKGSNTNIVGDLDSNEYTTADFEAASSGGSIDLEITYTDEINVRRTVETSVSFDPGYFDGRKAQEKSYFWRYVTGLIILVILAVWIYRAFFRKKPKKVY